MDSLAPAPTLPVSYLDLMVGAESGTITSAPEDDGIYYVNLGSLGITGNMYLFGSSVNYGYLSSNGLFSMYGCWGSISPFDNRELPDARFNDWCHYGIMMPFFDDLMPVPGESSITWEGTDSSFFVIQWNDFARYANPDARLTFRVTMGLAHPGWVLFQYIMMDGAGADGSSATIGIQSQYRNYHQQYSFNTAGAVVTGTAADGKALQAILYDYDGDRDGLPRHLETALSTNDNARDSDGGGLSDLYEFLNSLDPTSNTDDGTPTDTDADGLDDVEETYFGSALDSADGDEDGLTDIQEIFWYLTNPADADSDGDNTPDGYEIDQGTDPLDPASVPPINLATSSASHHKTRAVADAQGNLHAISLNRNNNNTIFYYHFQPDGTPLIAETILKFDGDGTYLTHPGLVYHAGRVYVLYEAIDNSSIVNMGVVVLNPSLDDRDGGPASAPAIEVTRFVLPTNGNARHHDVAVSATGLHVVYENQVRDAWPDGEGGPEEIVYLHVGFDGTLVSQRVLQVFSTTEGNGPGGYGIHKMHSPRIAVDEAGVAHVVYSAQTAPYYQYSNYDEYPTGMWYVGLDGNDQVGPYYIGHGRIERLDVETKGSLLYIATTNGYDTNESYYVSQGMRLAVLNTQSYSIIPRTGSYFGVDWAIDPETMVLPFTTIYANGEANQGGSVAVLDNGAAVIYFSDNWNDNLCLVGASITGTRLGEARCLAEGNSSKYTRYKAIVPLAGNQLGLVFDDWSSELFYINLAVSDLFDPAVVPPFNAPPVISSNAPDESLVEGETYTYTPAASDDATATADLVWSAQQLPTGMTVDAATGALAWTPGLGAAGVYGVVLTVCDDGEPMRCAQQSLQINVAAALPPVIVSQPAGSAFVDQPYSYHLVVLDPDSAAHTFEVVAPTGSGMAMSAQGRLTWTPTLEDVGQVAIVLRATDPAGLSATQSFTVTVSNQSNPRAPVIVSVPAGFATVQQLYSYHVVVQDADSASHTIELVAPTDAGMTMSTEGRLTWTPTKDQLGVMAIVVRATDAEGLAATQAFTVTVTTAPVEASSEPTITIEDAGGGCGCAASSAGGSLAWMMMLGLGMGFVRRRR